MLNQLRAGLRVRPEEQVDKPGELQKYEQMRALGLPVWEGGLQDQPHIWIEMVGLIEATVRLFDAISAANRKP